MKRIRLLVLLGAVVVALPLGVLFAGGSAGAQTASASVSIEPNAQYDVKGGIIHVEVKATCTGGAGAVVVEVVQEPPETPYEVGFGSGPNPVACDGRTHETGVTIMGAGFDAGKALATAELTVVEEPLGPVIAKDTETRYIDIRVV
jgi:hypothetical protein